MIRVGGVDLDVWVSPAAPGSAHLPPVVFLHEGLGSIGLWRSFPADVLAAVGAPRGVVYSRRGHGWSDPVGGPRRPDYMHAEADEVLPALLARLGVRRPVLVGHSDGASIALLYAGAGRAVEALVLLAPHVFVEELGLAGIRAARDAYETTDLRERMARHHRDPDATFRGWNDVWLSPAFRDWNIEDRLGAVTAPTLLVQGADDQYGSLAQLDAIERGVAGPTSRLVLAGVGHAPHLDAPAQTRSAVVAFILAGRERGAGAPRRPRRPRRPATAPSAPPRAAGRGTAG